MVSSIDFLADRNMLKRARRPSGFYASLFSDALDPNFKSKYRSKAKTDVMGTYEVERVVAKRLHGGKAEYFIPWKNYNAADNTWEPEAHLQEELVTSFETSINRKTKLPWPLKLRRLPCLNITGTW